MFVGAGGSHLGFRQQGDFKTLLVSDIDRDFCETFKYNNPGIKVIQEDIHNLTPRRVLQEAGIKKGELDVIFGGIVCKGFSLAGVRSPTDPRNDLYRSYIKLVKGIQPKVAIIENVPGMASMKILRNGDVDEEKIKEIHDAWNKLRKLNGLKSAARKGVASPKELEEIKEIEKNKTRFLKLVKEGSVNVVDDIIRLFNKAGYNVLEPRILNAADYGGATERKRLFIVAIRKDLDCTKFEWPKKSNCPKKTVRDALSQIDYSKEDEDNKPMKHQPKTIERFSYIPRGKNIVSVMDRLPEHLRISRFYSRGCTMRLEWDKPAPTLVPGHSNFPVHPDENRSITVREAAAIMGFPNNYKFFGSHTKRCEAVGQAVVVEMARALAQAVSDFLKKVS